MWRVASLALLAKVSGHGLLKVPRARNLVAFDAGTEDCPQCLQGGGPANVKARGQGVWPSKDAPGSHGLCGDPGQGLPNPSSPAEQRYMVPTPIQATYKEGQVVEFTVELTAHHRGHYEFRLCTHAMDGREDGFTEASGQECLDAHVLQRAEPAASCQANDPNPDCQPLDPEHPERWYVPPAAAGSWASNTHQMRFKLPPGVSCERCTLQWYYATGNTCWYDGAYKTYFNRMQQLGWDASAWAPWTLQSWATCENTCCNEQTFGEEFWNCADVAIGAGGSPPTPAPTPQPTRQATAAPSPAPTPQPTPSPSPTASPTSEPSEPGACQAAWGKCGGSGWQGPSCCVEGYTCVRQDEWYSQCIPTSLAQVPKRRKLGRHSFLGDHAMIQGALQTRRVQAVEDGASSGDLQREDL